MPGRCAHRSFPFSQVATGASPARHLPAHARVMSLRLSRLVSTMFRDWRGERSGSARAYSRVRLHLILTVDYRGNHHAVMTVASNEVESQSRSCARTTRGWRLT